MQMYVHRNDPDYIETRRPDRQLRNHGGIKFKIQTTKNQRVSKSPYYCGVYLWDGLPVEIQTLVDKVGFRRSIRRL